MFLDEELAQVPDSKACRCKDQEDLQHRHIEEAASQTLLVLSVEVLLLSLVLLVVNDCGHGRVNLVDALVEHVERACSRCRLIIVLFSAHVEVAGLGCTINHAGLTIKD